MCSQSISSGKVKREVVAIIKHLLFQFLNQDIFCCGQANEISILNSATLEVVRVWGGHSNWVTCVDLDDPNTGKSQLMTVTMEGVLEIWDFDTGTHALYKNQAISAKILDDTTCSPAFDVVKNKFLPRLFMVLTNKNILVIASYDNEFVPQFIIPAESETCWAGGGFYSKDQLVVWTKHGDIFNYKLKESATDRCKYKLCDLLKENPPSVRPVGDIYSKSIKISVYANNDELYAFIVCNHPEESGFKILPLPIDQQQEGHTTYSIDISFKEIWPIKDEVDPNFGRITVTEPVNTNHLAIGYDTGKICVVPLSLALLHLNDVSNHLGKRDDVRVFKKTHQSAITCMIVPEHQVSGQQYLLSGGLDGVVKIWNLNDGKFVASCAVHSTPVMSFIEPVEQKDIRVRGCIASIAQDNSVALISVDSMTCLFIFPGHPHPLTAIQWRTAEDYVVLGYSDDSAYVWQMQTAHLDRILYGKSKTDVMEDSRWPINHISASKTASTSNHGKHTVQIKSIVTDDCNVQVPNNFAQVFIFSIRRLVHDIYTRLSILNVHEQNNQIHPVLKASVSTSSSAFDAVVPDILSFRPDKDDPLDIHDGHQPKHDEELKEKKIELMTAIISIIASWNINEAFELLCNQTLNLSKQVNQNISYGIKGTNGNLSVVAPLKHEREAWTISPSVTAVRLLSISLLAKVVISMAGQESRSADLITGYAMSLPLVIGERYCFPSLSLLSKYWHDSSARSLFSSAVTGLSQDDINSLIDYWESFCKEQKQKKENISFIVPTSSENSNPQMMARASIILGIMGCDQPQTLDPRVRKSTALSLTILLSDVDLDTNNSDNNVLSTGSMARTLSSMELLSQGFKTWENYINAAEVLRTLFMYATDSQPMMALISRGAKAAIFQISITNMPLVISTLTFDTAHAKSLEDRLRCLKIIGIFIKKEPILLYSHVHNVVEAVIKTLDPNVPHMREVMVQSATSVLHDLVKTYPSVDFSSSAQKLAVGTLEGASVVYDIRTTTRSVVLEGHTGPVVALAFSPDAKLVATCSLFDQSVRVWHTNMSLFGMLTSSLTHTSHQRKSSSGSHKPDKIFSFALPNNSLAPSDIIRQVRFDWSSPKCVKLKICDLIMSFTV
ncbi:WD40 repeat-like protein [Rhizopus microsporus ATCC 52813]|uniref:WD40 repeat-like protein n=1 Tax=Rhizopus microsporus ATCC 52813 TaxID=1340429 RepID=A0A2G4SLY7_RHIZD|nr:WD40 repeat-like protein [Rhizopus microsporus ATCC 52813]PHZ09781.1 WD40 repeat-like protein [Rhizopus microsporus ATCC 52813]